MFPSCPLRQVYIRLQYKLACLALFLLLPQPSAAGIAIDATGFLLLTPPSLRGNLSTNDVLQTAERLHAGKVSVPHSNVVIGDDVFSATSSGLIINVAPCRPVIIANLRPRGCRTFQECGHLISIRRSADNMLIVLDAYRGVFEVHPVTGVTRKLLDSRAFVNGRPCVYLNDLVIMKDRTIILSDSSPRFDYAHEFWIRFEGRADGRLIGFSPLSGQSKEILSGLAYPTGLEISSNGQSLLVSEASRARILRLDLRKDKFFQRSYVNINLPGMPEHIRQTDRGTYWVALSYPRFRGELSPLDQYSNKAVSRNFMAARHSLNQIQQIYKRRGLAVELDEGGKILRSIHDPSGMKVGEVLEVTEYIGILYVGTRSQQATVRVVGDPKELNIDSVVQVLRSRCKVADDKIQATKASIEQQLQGNTTQKPPKSTAKSPVYTPAPPYTQRSDAQALKTEAQQRVAVNLKSLTQGLSKLHKALLNATVSNKKMTPVVQPPDSTYQQKEKPVLPPREQIVPIHQPPLITVNQHTVPKPTSTSTQAPTNEQQIPLIGNGTQRIEGMLSVQFSHNSVSPPTASSPSSIVQQFQEARLRSHATLRQQPQETSVGYQSVPQGVSSQKPQETSVGYSSVSQQDNSGQKPQETSVGYSSVSQQDNSGQKPQETSVGYSSVSQQDNSGQKPQETSVGYSSVSQQDNSGQKPQETSVGYSSVSQQDNSGRKPQDNFTGYPSQPQQGVQNQKPQDTSIGYSSVSQQDSFGQKSQETSIGYSSGQQNVTVQRAHETSIGYTSQPQQGVQNKKPQDTSIGYSSKPQQDASGQKPEETSIGYSSGQDVPGQKPQEIFTGYPSQQQQGALNKTPQETSIGFPPRSQQNAFGQKPRDMFVLGPQRVTIDQKPQEKLTDYSSGSQQSFLSQKPHESFIGYPSVPHQSDGSFMETSNYPVHIPIKQPLLNLLSVSSTQSPIFHKVETLSVTQSPPEVTTEMGGFMGFMGGSVTQNDASNAGYYSFQQDLGPLSDPGLFGQIEPGINMNPGASQRKHQFLPGMEPLVNFEQMPVPNDQSQNTEQTQPLHRSGSRPSHGAADMVVNSFQHNSPKRPDMNVQDISMKGAVEIQNMQMFHPTDRPELFIQPQNQAVAKTETTIQEKAQPFAIDTEPFVRTSLSQRTNEEYANVQSDHFQSKRPQAQESQRNSHLNTFEHGRVSSSIAGGIDSAISHVASNTQIELVDPSTPLHQSFSNGSF